MKTTIAQQLNVKEFPLIIKDSKGNRIYYERSDGSWIRREFDSEGNKIYYENSSGLIKGNRSIPEYTMGELIEKLGNFKLKIK